MKKISLGRGGLGGGIVIALAVSFVVALAMVSILNSSKATAQSKNRYVIITQGWTTLMDNKMVILIKVGDHEYIKTEDGGIIHRADCPACSEK